MVSATVRPVLSMLPLEQEGISAGQLVSRDGVYSMRRSRSVVGVGSASDISRTETLPTIRTGYANACSETTCGRSDRLFVSTGQDADSAKLGAAAMACEMVGCSSGTRMLHGAQPPLLAASGLGSQIRCCLIDGGIHGISGSQVRISDALIGRHVGDVAALAVTGRIQKGGHACTARTPPQIEKVRMPRWYRHHLKTKSVTSEWLWPSVSVSCDRLRGVWMCGLGLCRPCNDIPWRAAPM